MEEGESNHKSTRKEILIFVLATIVIINLVVTMFLLSAYHQTSFNLETTNIVLKDLLNRVQTTAKYVTIGNITLAFTPYMPVQMVPSTTITYLLGFATVSNLKNIIARPLTLVVQFIPNVTCPENGTVTYEYTKAQILEIPPNLDMVQMPWGCFPLILEDFKVGDIIFFGLEITAYCEWVGNEVTRVSLTVTYKLVVT